MGFPKITKIEIDSFTWDVKGMVHQRAYHYQPDSTLTFTGSGIKITADNGVVGEFAGWRTSAQGVASIAERYIGHLQFKGPSAMQGYYLNPVATEKAYQDGISVRFWDFLF